MVFLFFQAIQDNQPFQRVTPGAQDIHHLFIWFLAAAAFVFVVVMGFMFWRLYKYRYRGEEGDPPQDPGSLKVEMILTLASFGLVFLFIFLTIRTMVRMHHPPKKGQKPDIVIIAHQWWWEAKYPKPGFETANEVHFPVGKRMEVKFKSADVVHDWWVPALGKKMDIFPGRTTHLSIKIEKPGEYYGTCAEYCGAEHGRMHIHVIAQSPKKFKAWEKHQEQPAKPSNTKRAMLGNAIFNSLSCGRCHNINGNPSADGHDGPDLTHLISRKTILTFVENTPKNLHHWINHTQQMKKGANMPPFRFNKKQLNAVVAYLEGLK